MNNSSVAVLGFQFEPERDSLQGLFFTTKMMRMKLKRKKVVVVVLVLVLVVVAG